MAILREREDNDGAPERRVRQQDFGRPQLVSRHSGVPAASPGWSRRLALPATHAAADEALALTQKVDEALVRLQNGIDPDALHDFRVAVRRLRAWLRGFKPVLAVRRRTRRRLQKLSQRSNRARDAQAALAWLQSATGGLTTRTRNSVQMLETELAASVAETAKTLPMRAEKDWTRAARRLRKELMDRAPERGVEESFGDVWAEALERALAEVVERRRKATAGEDDEAIHYYRISLKRVRYLLEPAVQELPDAMRAVKQAKRGQEQAGAINDLQHLLGWMRRRSRELAAQRGAAAFELRLAGRDTEARRVVARAGRRLRPLVVAGRLAMQELGARTSEFEQVESRGREPRFANGVRRVIQALRTTESRPEPTSPAAPNEAARRSAE